MPVNRIVALLTPVFAAGAAIGSAYLAKWGISATPGQIEVAEIAGATTVLAPALSWLHGHQLWEARLKTAGKGVEGVVHALTTVDPELFKELEARVDERVKAVLDGLEVKVTPQAAPQAPAAT
jgi:hypothetical protein